MVPRRRARRQSGFGGGASPRHGACRVRRVDVFEETTMAAATFHPAYHGPERRVSRAPYAGPERRGGAPSSLRGGTDSRVKLFGHPVHQQLVGLPVGLLAGAVLFDLFHLASGSPTLATASFWMLVAGIAGALAAAPFGYLDWSAIPEKTRAKRIGAMHGIGNVVALTLFVASAVGRMDQTATPPTWASGLSIAAGAIIVVTAWLGGELVSRLGVGVSPEVGLDAPSSLRGPH
jgi:uncharacterized membrane protein